MSSALGEAARNSNGLCAAATSAPLAAMAASASSAAHLSSSSLRGASCWPRYGHGQGQLAKTD